jgi:hypothetical protein
MLSLLDIHDQDNDLFHGRGTDRAGNVSSITACSIVAGEKFQLSFSLATAVVLSPVYKALTWP